MSVILLNRELKGLSGEFDYGSELASQSSLAQAPTTKSLNSHVLVFNGAICRLQVNFQN